MSIKVVILAGGRGTRLAEETELVPKPMVHVGPYPIIWHIMKIFERFGLNDFYIATGYKGEIIKGYFLNYLHANGSMMIDLANGHIVDYAQPPEKWKVHLIETGLNAQTGGRIKMMQSWLDGPSPFIVTYGDGLANVDVDQLLRFHQSHGKLATVTAVRPPARFGAIEMAGDRVTAFTEKKQTAEGWINGGFMVFNRDVFNYLKHDSDTLEKAVLERLANDEQLMAFKHFGFWQCMDTQRDKINLDLLWRSGNPPWNDVE